MKKKLLALGCSIILLLGYLSSPWQPLDFRQHQQGEINTHNKNTRLLVIGLDEEGNPEDPTALDKVSQRIKAFKPKIVFFFVHGWRGDGSKENEKEGDLGRYKSFLGTVSQTFGTHPLLKKWKQERVLGVYIAWHGHARSYLPYLTFWNRYAAASRIGENKAIFPKLQALFQTAYSHSTRRSPVRVILFSHSMGGRIVNGWLNQLHDPLALHKKRKMPDLSLIINPAAPSKQYDSFVNSYHQHHARDEHTPPLIISIASLGDTATRWFYPIGTFERAIGHKHQTHQIEPIVPPQLSSRCREEDSPFAYNVLCDEFPDQRIFRSSHGYYTIVHQHAEDTPYWTMRLPPSLLKDHLSFFDEDFVAFTGALFKYSKTSLWRK